MLHKCSTVSHISWIRWIGHTDWIVGGASVEGRYIVIRGVVVIPDRQSKEHIAVRVILCAGSIQCWTIDCELDTVVQWICQLNILVSDLYRRKMKLLLTPLVTNIIRSEMRKLMKYICAFWYFFIQPRRSICGRICFLQICKGFHYILRQVFTCNH